MEIEVSITREDYLEFNKYVFLNKRMKRSFKIATFFVVLWLLILNINQPFNLTIILIEILVFYGLWALLIYVSSLYTQKQILKMPEEEGTFLGNKKYEVREDGLFEKTNKSESITNWNGIMNLQQNDKYLFIFVDKIAAYIIPKRYFKNEKEMDSFTDTIQNRIVK